MQTPIYVSASYTAVVVLLGFIAALFFKFSPIRHEQVSSHVLRSFMCYFGALGLIFVFYMVRLAGIQQLSILFISASYLIAIYSLRHGLKWRNRSTRGGLHRSPLFWWHLTFVLILNGIVFYYWWDSAFLRALVLYLSCAAVHFLCIKELRLDKRKVSWGEGVTRVGLYAVIGIFLLNCFLLGITDELDPYISMMMVTHSILILIMTGGLMSLLLSDVVSLHYQNSVKDPLTGLYNRRYFSDQAQVIQESSKRYEFPVSLVLCDIDNFKSVNDTFGHEAGDYVIKDFASKISNFIREGDLLARFGGEEFVLLLPQTKIENAKKFAERLRQIIEETEIDVRGHKVSYTASFGVSQLLNHGDLDFSLNAADEALYRAKNEGRNAVRVSPLAAVFN